MVELRGCSRTHSRPNITHNGKMISHLTCPNDRATRRCVTLTKNLRSQKPKRYWETEALNRSVTGYHPGRGSVAVNVLERACRMDTIA